MGRFLYFRNFLENKISSSFCNLRPEDKNLPMGFLMHSLFLKALTQGNILVHLCNDVKLINVLMKCGSHAYFYKVAPTLEVGIFTFPLRMGNITTNLCIDF